MVSFAALPSFQWQLIRDLRTCALSNTYILFFVISNIQSSENRYVIYTKPYSCEPSVMHDLVVQSIQTLSEIGLSQQTNATTEEQRRNDSSLTPHLFSRPLNEWSLQTSHDGGIQCARFSCACFGKTPASVSLCFQRWEQTFFLWPGSIWAVVQVQTMDAP